MIRTIDIEHLRVGMYVVDLQRQWFNHTFWRTQFLIANETTLEEVKRAGLTEVRIDTEKGDDAPPEWVLRGKRPPVKSSVAVEAEAGTDADVPELSDIIMPPPRAVSLEEERRRARYLMREAQQLVNDLVLSACRGEVVDAGRLEPVVSKMIDSVDRNPSALLPLARQKQTDTYAIEHAVASTSLVIALAGRQGVRPSEVENIALGNLVKDIGQASLDARLIAKPGSLSQSERNRVHNHVEEGLAILHSTSRLSDLSTAVVLEHHERFDGLGYPYKTAGESISIAGRMAAIADTYDAMTSNRPYRRAMSPTAALGEMYKESGRQFDPALLGLFIKTVGIYPVGTLVRLESGHLAVVESVSPDKVLQPIVRVVYNGKQRAYVSPVVVDLSRKYGNHYGQIVSAESFDRWGLNPASWQVA